MYSVSLLYLFALPLSNVVLYSSSSEISGDSFKVVSPLRQILR